MLTLLNIITEITLIGFNRYAQLRLNHARVRKARLRLKARIDVFIKVVCQISEHQSVNIAFGVYCYPRVIIFTMIEPSAAPSAARAQVESSKKRNAIT